MESSQARDSCPLESVNLHLRRLRNLDDHVRIWPKKGRRRLLLHPYLHPHYLQANHFSLTAYQDLLRTSQAILDLGLNPILNNYGTQRTNRISVATSQHQARNLYIIPGSLRSL